MSQYSQYPQNPEVRRDVAVEVHETFDNECRSMQMAVIIGVEAATHVIESQLAILGAKVSSFDNVTAPVEVDEELSPATRRAVDTEDPEAPLAEVKTRYEDTPTGHELSRKADRSDAEELVLNQTISGELNVDETRQEVLRIIDEMNPDADDKQFTLAA